MVGGRAVVLGGSVVIGDEVVKEGGLVLAVSQPNLPSQSVWNGMGTNNNNHSCHETK